MFCCSTAASKVMLRRTKNAPSVLQKTGRVLRNLSDVRGWGAVGGGRDGGVVNSVRVNDVGLRFISLNGMTLIYLGRC